MPVKRPGRLHTVLVLTVIRHVKIFPFYLRNNSGPFLSPLLLIIFLASLLNNRTCPCLIPFVMLVRGCLKREKESGDRAGGGRVGSGM